MMPSDDAPLPADPSRSHQPYFSVGAGNLASFLWKQPRENADPQYEFNLFRVTDHGRVSHLLTPTDLLHVIKLVQAIAFALTDESDLSPPEQQKLARLAASLDQSLRQFQKTSGSASSADPCGESRPCAPRPPKGHHR